MPTFALDITGLTDRTPVIGGRLVEYGHIFALAARIHAGTSKTGRTHVQAGIYIGTPAEDRILNVLLDDYVYDGHMPTWTGRLPMDEGTGIYAIVRSADAPIVRIIGYIQKNDP